MSETFEETLIAEKIRAMQPAEMRVADSVDHIVQWLAKDLDHVTALIDHAPSLGGAAVVINKEHMKRALQDTRERLCYWLATTARDIRENLVQRPVEAEPPCEHAWTEGGTDAQGRSYTQCAWCKVIK